MNHLYITTFLVFLFIQTFAQIPGEIGPLTSIDSYTTFQGYEETQAHLGQGEYQIYYDNINGVLDKPLIICDGFDPEDSGDINSIYNYLTYNNPPQNFLEELRDVGIDVIILNFPTYERPSDGAIINGGADYIERNGLVLVNLIETIKAEQVGSKEFVLVGPSMGGLVSRYALTYMEQNALDHNSGLWISYDSPHRGANVPISFQYAVNYLAEVSGDPDMQAMRDVELNSSAAKQMLLDHYSVHLLSGDPFLQDPSIQLPTHNGFRDTFMTTMVAFGFPTTTRNLSVVNGSLDGVMVESPGVTILSTSLDLGSGAGADITLHFTPNIGITNYEVDYLQPTYAGIPIGDPFYAYAESPTYTAGLDSAPGGTVLFDSYFGSDPTPFEQQIIDALQIDAFSFIPTLSSLAIDEQDWYDAVDGSENIPFDDYIGGNDNEPHMSFNQSYATFLYDEIASILIRVDEVTFAQSFSLLSNPVKESIYLRCNSQFNNSLSIKLINTTGQLIASYNVKDNDGILTIPSPKNNGLYYLHISDINYQAVIKVIVQR